MSIIGFGHPTRGHLNVVCFQFEKLANLLSIIFCWSFVVADKQSKSFSPTVFKAYQYHSAAWKHGLKWFSEQLVDQKRI